MRKRFLVFLTALLLSIPLAGVFATPAAAANHFNTVNFIVNGCSHRADITTEWAYLGTPSSGNWRLYGANVNNSSNFSANCAGGATHREFWSGCRRSPAGDLWWYLGQLSLWEDATCYSGSSQVDMIGSQNLRVEFQNAQGGQTFCFWRDATTYSYTLC